MADAPADLSQRRRALSLESSFIVQAPAGSGKTELLIQRYLALLAIVNDPEEIVAITFTRKAASEMRGRILEALDAARSGTLPEGGDALVTVELARAALARDGTRNWDLAGNPGRLRVQTVDALCAHLTRHLPMLSRFGSQPDTVEDASAAYAEAAAATLAHLEWEDEWSDSLAVLLAHLDNDFLRAGELIAALLGRREQWLEHVIEPSRPALESGLRRLIESVLAAAAAAFPREHSPELMALLGFASAHLEDSPYRDMRAMPGSAAGDAAAWNAIAGFLLTNDGNWRKTADARLGFPAAGKGPGAAERGTMKRRFQDLLMHLAESENLRRLLLEVRRLPSAAYTEEDWLSLQALCRVLHLADAELSLAFARRDQIDFAGVTRAALTALGREEDPTDLALYLDYQIRHLLVDEFQDISATQYQLLRMLTAGWSAGDGRSLFLVGDPMQSIYRFREAAVGLFIDTWEQRRLGQVPLTPLSITVNFRSAPVLVEWVNRVFSGVMPPCMDSGRGAVVHAPSAAHLPPATSRGVQLHAVADSMLEAERVVALVEAARERDPAGDVAILVCNRSALAEILPALKRRGLRFRALDIEELGRRPPIQDLLALTRALHRFSDRIAWLALLRGPACGLTLSDLLLLCGSGKEMVWQAMHDEARVASLSPPGQALLLRLRGRLQTVLEERGRRRLRRWVESAWLRIGGPATLASKTDLVDADTFFRLLEDLDEGGELQDLEQLAAKVDSLFAAPDTEADERLQVLTIHKAKGLEFDTVILPGLSRLARPDERRLLVWTVRVETSGRPDLLLAPIRRADDEQAAAYDFLARIEKEKDDYEEARLLYVAATRARRELHLVSVLAEAPPVRGSLLAILWPVLAAEFPPATASPQAVQPEAMESRSISRIPAEWRMPEPAPDARVPPTQLAGRCVPVDTAIEFDWAGKTIMHVGTTVHGCLHRIGTDGIAAWNTARVQETRGEYQSGLKRLGVPTVEIAQASAEVERALCNLLEDQRGRWLLDEGHRERRSEWSLSGLRAGRLVHSRIDLSFVDSDDVRWVVDYKTSRHEGPDVAAFLDREAERYREQLEEYAALVAAIENRQIRIGLYFPLLRGWREWKYEG